MPFPNNIIPPSEQSPIALELLQYYPLPNVPGAGLVNNYLALDNNQLNKDEFTQRIDFVENAKSSWFFRYSWDSDFQAKPQLYLNGNNLNVSADQAVLSNTRILSATMGKRGAFWFQLFPQCECARNHR